MKAQLRPGAAWSALTCTDVRIVRKTKTLGPGITETFDIVTYDLECQCGKRLSMSAADFPGRRHMKDCGCGTSVNRMPTVIAVYLPLKLVERVDARASAEGLSRSRLIRNLLISGMVNTNQLESTQQL